MSPSLSLRAAFSCFVFTAFVSACGGGGGGGNAANTSPAIVEPVAAPQTLAQQLDTYLASAPADQPGISVLVAQGGAELYSVSKGMANVVSATPVTRNTAFRLASVSKPFTAVAVMQLVERGQIKLNDSILDFLPELPAHWRPITIGQLLTHQSGIFDIVNDPKASTLLDKLSLDALLTYLTTNRPALEFTPGSRGEYNNTGYMLLAKIIERRTGKRFGDHMAEAIFKPAGMVHSYINDEFQPIKAGDALNFGNLTTLYGATTYIKGATAQMSSADDFLHFFQALLGGRLVTLQTLAEMSRMQTTAGIAGPYGVGFQLFSPGYGHAGEDDGFRTLMVIDTARNRAWVALTNSGSRGATQINEVDRIIRRVN